jgi:transcriptional regulator with XRE-family HTH domain
MSTNPFKRLRELTTTSQKDFAEKYGFAKTTMTYIESGQYPDLSEAMIVGLGQECYEKNVDARSVLIEEYQSESLQDAYHRWQSIERMAVAHRFQVNPTGQMDEVRSPMHFFVEQVAGTRQAFCKLLKVPSAAVLQYSTGRIKTMPKAITDALTEVRFPYLTELQDQQIDWLNRWPS